MFCLSEKGLCTKSFRYFFHIHSSNIITQILLKMSGEAIQATHQNIVYIISQNFTKPHIEHLIDQLYANQIPIQLQTTDHDSLGVPLDRRYFIVVDNAGGTVALGPWFTSLVLFIVGYPKKGANKKNHYCNRPQQVVNKYEQFCALPQFVKKSYLSSSIASRSFLKSARSSISNPKTVSEFSNSMKVEQKIQLNQKSKLFLLSSSTNSVYNKWVLKIAASNPKKIQVLESVSDLQLTLMVCRCKANFLLVSAAEFQEVRKKNIKELKVIVYEQKIGEISRGRGNHILGIFHSHTEIIRMIRKIGFQVISLKDIDKSIVKYGNPFANQLTSKSTRKIFWGNKSGLESEASQKGCFNKIQQQNVASSQNLRVKNQFTIQSALFVPAAPLGSRSSLRQTPNTISLQKRSSIQGQVLKCQIAKAQIKLNIQHKKSVGQNLQQPREQNGMCKKNQSDIKVEINNVGKLPLKIKKIRCKSLQSKLGKSCNKASSKTSSIDFEQQNYTTKVSQNENFSIEKSNNQNHIFDLSKGSFILKEQLIESVTNSFPESINLNLKSSNKDFLQRKMNSVVEEQKTEQKQNNYTSWSKKRATLNSPKIIYKKNLLNIQQRLLRRKGIEDGGQKKAHQTKMLENQLDSLVVIWKDFNFNIENCKQNLIRHFDNKNLVHRSFYSEQELAKILLNQTKPNLILFLDEVSIEKYISICKNKPSLSHLVGIYIFEKQKPISASSFQHIQRQIESWQNNGNALILRPILMNEYADESREIAQDMFSCLLAQNNV